MKTNKEEIYKKMWADQKELYARQTEALNTCIDSYQGATKSILEYSKRLSDLGSRGEYLRYLLERSLNLIAETPGLSEIKDLSDRELAERVINYRENLYKYIISRGLMEDFLKYHEENRMLDEGGHEEALGEIFHSTPPDEEAPGYIDPKLN